MALPLVSDVRAFLGLPTGEGGDDAHLQSHLDTAAAMVKAYVRDNGFDPIEGPGDDLAAVIVSSAARSASNPTLATSVGVDDAQVRPGTFHGWTLAELSILHRYRRRAQ